MKRKPLIFALALLLVVSAALWGVNYRLYYPPLTPADKEFRALLAGADGVRAIQYAIKSPTQYKEVEIGQLNDLQKREIINNIRLIDFSINTGQANNASISFLPNGQNKNFQSLTIIQSQNSTKVLVEDSNSAMHGYLLNPRFNKRLNRTLDAYLPQRIRP